jgi:hypothetical protein
MKTLTEFSSLNLRNAIKTHDEVVASGKTAEELPTALGEALKAEGDKLTRLLAAIDIAKKGKLEKIKRILVMSPQEGETAPAGLEKREELYYMTELFPSAEPKKAFDPRDVDPRARGGKGGRGDKKGDRGGERGARGPGGPGSDRGAGGPGGDRGPRAPHAPRAPREGGPSVIVVSGAGGPAGEQAPRGDRPPRAPRAPRPPHPPRDPSLPPARIIPRSELAAAAPASSVAAPTGEAQAPQSSPAAENNGQG